MNESPGSPASPSESTHATAAVDRPRVNWWLVGIAIMSVAATIWLSYQTWRFFLDPTPLAEKHRGPGAIDLYSRFNEVNAWFRGGQVYNRMADAMHPPATFALLWPVLGNLSWMSAKVVWYSLSLACLYWLSRQLVEQSLASSRLQRTFIGLMPFATYAAGAAIGNGQLVTILLPILLFALLPLAKASNDSNRNSWLNAAAMLWTLVQPTIAAPFFWLMLFRSEKKRYAIAIVAGYLALTLIANSYQAHNMKLSKKAVRLGKTPYAKSVLRRWTERATNGARHGSLEGGYGSVHDLMLPLGVNPRLNMVASVLILAALGAWTFAYRRIDLWLLLGVTALVARFWTYHRWYDDLLLLLPLVSLFRVTQLPQYQGKRQLLALGLFVVVWGFSLAPGVLYTLPALASVQVISWLATLVFLLTLAHGERRLVAIATV